MESTQLAKKAISEIFQAVRISRTVFVDDHLSEVGVDKAIALIAQLNPSEVQLVEGLESIDFDDDIDMWSGTLRQTWDQLDRSKHAKIYSRLTEIAGDISPLLDDENSEPGKIISDDFAMARLREMIPGELIPLTPIEWDAQSKTLLEETKFSRTLFLFDEELHKGGGRRNLGNQYIQEILEEVEMDNAICGLISNLFRTEGEVATYESLKDRGLDPDRIVPLSKDNLQDPARFAERIKLTAISPSCKELRDKVAEIEALAYARAKERIADFNIYLFDKIIFKGPNREGTWEPETLFRLHGIFQRKEARRLALSEDSIHTLAAKIRVVSQIYTGIEQMPTNQCKPGLQANTPIDEATAIDQPTGAESSMDSAPSLTKVLLDAWHIQREELYDDGDYLNIYHLPIELGDIFEKTSGQKAGTRYFLIAQPCDLMVRPETGARRAGVTDVVLAEMSQDQPHDKKGQPMQSESYYELPYFDKTDGKTWYVDFRKTVTVRLFMLDLCVYNADGTSRFTVDKDCPKTVLLAWKKAYEGLNKKIEKAIDTSNKLADKKYSNLPQEIRQLGIPKVSEKELFVGKIETENTLSYDIKRIGRLNHVHAAAALLKFSAYTSRPAFELDFGK
jgi:hypothetical protein